MCGRFALGLPHDEIEQLHGYNVHVGEWVGRDQFVPRYNVAPRTQAPVIRGRDQGEGEGSSGSGSSGGGSSSQPAAGPSTRRPSASEPSDTPASDNNTSASTSHPHPGTPPAPTPAEPKHEPHAGPADAPLPLPVTMQTMRWGLVPHFSKHEDAHGALKTINARSEALIEETRGMWASIKGRKRCAVVCQGYYEWLKKGKERLPHFTKRADGRLMLLAGLWDRVVLEGSTEPLWTFTIVTTDASKELSWLHDRQPVILPDEAALKVWLDTSAGTWTGELSKLCAPYHASDHPLTCYAVPKEVGKIGTESPTFVQPVADRKDGIQAMFAKQSRKDTKPAAAPAQSSTRKRSASPETGTANVKREGQPGAKKARVEKVNAWDDDSDIEYIDDPRTGGGADDSKHAKKTSSPKGGHQKPTKSPQKAVEKPSKASPRETKTADQHPSSSAKITSFFVKK